MTENEILEALARGAVVYWKSQAYQVEKWASGLMVVCPATGNVTGVSKYHNPEDFYTDSIPPN